MMYPVLSLPQVNDFNISESGNIALKTSAKFSFEVSEWCFSAVWRHHNTSARSVAVPPRATLMSTAEDEEETAQVVAVASGVTAGGVTTLALGCGGATRLPQKLAMESCRSQRLAAALWLAQHMWDFNELMPIDTILIFFLHNV